MWKDTRKARLARGLQKIEIHSFKLIIFSLFLFLSPWNQADLQFNPHSTTFNDVTLDNLLYLSLSFLIYKMKIIFTDRMLWGLRQIVQRVKCTETTPQTVLGVSSQEEVLLHTSALTSQRLPRHLLGRSLRVGALSACGQLSNRTQCIPFLSISVVN